VITYTRRQDLSTPAALNGRLPHLTRWLRSRAASPCGGRRLVSDGVGTASILSGLRWMHGCGSRGAYGQAHGGGGLVKALNQ
jgi:hypothetical protein